MSAITSAHVSAHAAATPASGSAGPLSPFMERIIAFLLPYFFTIPEDMPFIRADILDTIASYGARTRAEMLNAARIIATSFSALELLADAKDAAMSDSMRLRYRGCANRLNGYAQKDEAALAKRLRQEQPARPDPRAEPADGLTPEELEVETARAYASLAELNARLAGIHESYGLDHFNHAGQGAEHPHQDAGDAPWSSNPGGSAMMGALPNAPPPAAAAA